MATLLPLALTIGEPAGIGPDIALIAWLRRKELDVPPFYLLAETEFLGRRAETLGLKTPLRAVAAEASAATFPSALPVVGIDQAITARPGLPDATSGPAAVASLNRGVDDVHNGKAAALVTGPVSKAVLYRAGFTDPGHTEYLARRAAEMTGAPVKPVMMLWSDALAVVPITIHISLKEVPPQLSTALIVDTARIVVHDLKQRFGIPVPRIAVAGLNPHAGEEGAMGKEDQTIVAPAVEQLRSEGIAARGPFPADTLFHAAARAGYDVALCMYHDQALIPIKTLAFDRAVNVTLGLPFIRTSPDHGPAFDIAGTGRADPGSLVAALKLAARLAEKTAHTASA